VLLAVALGVSLAACGESGPKAGSATTTQHLHATETGIKRIFLSQKAFQPGDSFIARSELDGGGHKDAYCVISPKKENAWCSVTVVRPQGQVTAQGVFTNSPRLSGTIALLSGSGAYEGARGSFVTTGVTARDESITLRLL
jgi:hypothetical protein